MNSSDLLVLFSMFVWAGSLLLLFGGLVALCIRAIRRIGLFMLAGSVPVWIASMGMCVAAMPTIDPIEEKRDSRTREGRAPAGTAVTYQIESSNEIRVLMGRDRPTLVVRCRGRQTDVYVITGTAHAEGPLSGSHPVRVRVDDQPWEDAMWSESVDDDTMFAPDGLALAGRIASARRLSFEFRPLYSRRQTVTFDLAGVASGVGRVAKACGWTAPRALE